MILVRGETLPLARHAEVLARETARYDIDPARENILSRIMPLYQIHDTIRVVHITSTAETRHILRPSYLGLFQDIVGENRTETSPAQAHPTSVEFFRYPVLMRGHRPAMTNKVALESQVHAPASREQRKHAQVLGAIILLPHNSISNTANLRKGSFIFIRIEPRNLPDNIRRNA